MAKEKGIIYVLLNTRMKKDNKIFPDRTLIWQSENHGYFWHDLYVYSVYNKELIKSIIGFQENNILVTNYENQYSFYLDILEIQNNESKYIKFCMSNQYQKFKKNIKHIISKKKWNINHFFKKNWKSHLNKFCQQYIKSVSYYCCTESYYTNALYKMLTKKYSKRDIDELIRPIYMPSIIKSQVEWYSLCLQPFSEKHLLDYYNKWKDIACSHKTNPYSLQQLRERYSIDTLHKLRIQKNYNSILNSYSKSTIKKIKNAIQSFPPQDAKYIRILSEITYLRFELRHVWMKLGYQINSILKNVFNKNYNRIVEFGLKEILSDTVDFEQNRANFIYEKNNGNDYLYYNGLEIEKNIEIMKKNKPHYIGTSSYGKNVIGETLIVTSINNLRNNYSLEDKILIIPQITPDYIPFVGLCKGIITNEGGITGHANIIVREMNIPAILGVNNATTNIQSGIKVELDIKAKKIKVINHE